MVTALPAIAPDVPSSPNWKSIGCSACGSNFKYYLTADNETWYTWKFAVDNEDNIYDVIDIVETQSTTFSPFVLMVKLTTAAQYDGGCFET